MEDSFYSSPVTKPAASRAAAGERSEESGWTAYFQDFSNQVDDDDDDDDDDDVYSLAAPSSMVSDAASHAAWRSVSHRSHVADDFSLGGSPKTPSKLSFKKTRTKQISARHDDSLEDTASSPVNSPKIGHHMNPRKTNDHHMDISLGNGGTSEYYSEVVSEGERRMIMMGINGKNECIDLKKRGLCLAPLSMLVNYLG